MWKSSNNNNKQQKQKRLISDLRAWPGRKGGGEAVIDCRFKSGGGEGRRGGVAEAALVDCRFKGGGGMKRWSLWDGKGTEDPEELIQGDQAINASSTTNLIDKPNLLEKQNLLHKAKLVTQASACSS